VFGREKKNDFVEKRKRYWYTAIGHLMMGVEMR